MVQLNIDPGEETLGGRSTLLSHSSKKKEVMWNSKKKDGGRKGYIKYIKYISNIYQIYTLY